MERYEKAKQITDSKLQSLQEAIQELREKSTMLQERYNAFLQKQEKLKEFHGGSDVSGTDLIKINVGGTIILVHRDTLRAINGSRLDVLFSGRWENKILRDGDGYVFFDMNPIYFEKVVEYLHNRKKADSHDGKMKPKLPKFENAHMQKEFDLYIDIFQLEKDKQNESHVSTKDRNDIQDKIDEDSKKFEDVKDSLCYETEELQSFEKHLKEMESKLEEEKEHVSFFFEYRIYCFTINSIHRKRR